MPTPIRPYVIVGAGAIGGTLGHHLARAGHPVTVVDADPEVVEVGAPVEVVWEDYDNRAIPRARLAGPGTLSRAAD